MLNPSALLETAHAVWKRHAGAFMLDATAGNGHDTVFLAELAGEDGVVLAVDCQEQALTRSALRLREHGLEQRVRLRLGNHAEMGTLLDRELPTTAPLLALAVFNLGFLPGSDKRVTTSAASTLAALDAVWPRLRPGGLLSVHSYSGHPGAMEETQAVAEWMRALPWREAQVGACSQWNKPKNAETLWLAVKNLY